MFMPWQTKLLFCTRAASEAETSTLFSALLFWQSGTRCLPMVARKWLKSSRGAVCLSEEALAQVLLVAWLSSASKPPGASVLSESPLVFLADWERDVASACAGSQMLQYRRQPSGCRPGEHGSADGLMEIIPVGNVLVQ